MQNHLDSRWDSWFFGVWANPESLTVITVVNGEVFTHVVDYPESYVGELFQIPKWKDDYGQQNLKVT